METTFPDVKEGRVLEIEGDTSLETVEGSGGYGPTIF